ncbi:MAG: methyl-accepting chemotaxis protein [Anaerovibrio sp.]|nr:methyl-accepting chemotaxis protein [Anaerovibrio sp.]
MNLKQKFALLAACCGLLMAIISVIGLFSANNTLEESVEAELMASVQAENGKISKWVEEKAAMARAAADVITDAGSNAAAITNKSNLAMGKNDSDILAVAAASKEGLFFDYKDGDISKDIDPRTRDWFIDASKNKKPFVTEAYEDAVTHKLVVSCIAPFNGTDGQFYGAICEDVEISKIEEMIADFKYRGSGAGYVVQPTGEIIGSNDGTTPLEKVETKPWGSHFQEMVKNGKGFFVDEGNVIAYSTLADTGWLAAVVVSQDVVFAPVHNLRNTFIAVCVVGILLIIGACLMFGRQLQGVAVSLKDAAEEMAGGNLSAPAIEITTADELGDMAQSFNKMHEHLRNVIKRMANTASQVAAASEELTANASQSADVSVSVAETVGDMANGMDSQLADIDVAKQNVDMVYGDITIMADKAKSVAEATAMATAAASKGQSLMEDAISKMNNIERSVTQSSEVVASLGENSQQIGQIVDAISAISEQTNLLALNAAIEAARAGEHGRGFAVVAEEVRKLASESQSSAEEIRQRISNIQSETVKAVKTMETGTTDVKEGIESIRNVGEQFKEIMTKVSGIGDQMKEINGSVETVSQGANSIVEAVDSIDKVSRASADQTQMISSSTEEQSASNEEIAAAAHSLAKLAEEMNDEVSKFRY